LESKKLPGHSQYSRYDPIELTQNVEESREHNSYGTRSQEYIFDRVDACVVETDLCSVSRDRSSAELLANGWVENRTPTARRVAKSIAYPLTDPRQWDILA